MPAGRLGAIIERVLRRFGLAWTDLRIKHLKDIFFSKGSRPCLFFPGHLVVAPKSDELHPGRRALRLSVRAAEGVLRDDPGQADHRRRGGRAMNLDVLYEDNHCLAVNKPAGLPSQAGRVGGPSARGPRVAISQGAVRQAGKRLCRAGASARSADVRCRAPRQDEQGRGPAGRAVPRGADREGLLGDRGREARTRTTAPGPTGLEKDRRINRSRTLDSGSEGAEGGERGFPRAGTMAGFGETGVAALDRAQPSTPGATGKSGLPIVGDVKYGAGSRIEAMDGGGGLRCMRGG